MGRARFGGGRRSTNKMCQSTLIGEGAASTSNIAPPKIAPAGAAECAKAPKATLPVATSWRAASWLRRHAGKNVEHAQDEGLLTPVASPDSSERAPGSGRGHEGPWQVRSWMYTETGARHANEDRFLFRRSLPLRAPDMVGRAVSCFGVFDGHGGSSCAAWVTAKLEAAVVECSCWERDDLPVKERLRRAMEASLMRVEMEWTARAARVGDFTGACVVFGLFCDGDLCVANIGDCRSVLVSQGTSAEGMALELSEPHRCVDAPEAARILAKGGNVTDGRAFGILEPSRTIGDADVKAHCPGAVIALPHITELSVESVSGAGTGGGGGGGKRGTPPFVILASDGVWDMMDKAKVVEKCRKSLKQQKRRGLGRGLPVACGRSAVPPAQTIVEAAVAAGTKDDATAVVVELVCQAHV